MPTPQSREQKLEQLRIVYPLALNFGDAETVTLPYEPAHDPLVKAGVATVNNKALREDGRRFVRKTILGRKIIGYLKTIKPSANDLLELLVNQCDGARTHDGWAASKAEQARAHRLDALIRAGVILTAEEVQEVVDLVASYQDQISRLVFADPEMRMHFRADIAKGSFGFDPSHLKLECRDVPYIYLDAAKRQLRIEFKGPIFRKEVYDTFDEGKVVHGERASSVEIVETGKGKVPYLIVPYNGTTRIAVARSIKTLMSLGHAVAYDREINRPVEPKIDEILKSSYAAYMTTTVEPNDGLAPGEHVVFDLAAADDRFNRALMEVPAYLKIFSRRDSNWIVRLADDSRAPIREILHAFPFAVDPALGRALAVQMSGVPDEV